MEQWRFITAPVVCGGADLLVTLRGVAVQEDVHCQTRVEIEEMLHARQTQRIVGDILDDLVSGVRTPPRSRSPIDAHITPEEVFTRNNPGLHYRDTQINELREVYAELCPDTEWDLSIDRIKQACMDLGEDEEEKREEVLHKLNEIVVKLSFPKFTPIQENMHRVGCQVLREAIDAIVGQSMLIRHFLRLPSRDLDEMPEEDRRKGDRRDTIKKSASKDPAKVKSVNKFDTRSSKPNSKTPSKVQSRILAGQGENTRSLSPPEQPASPLDKLEMSDPNLMRKYTEKLNSQAYLIMRDCVNKMADAFEEIQKIEGEAYAFDLLKSTS